MLAIDPQGRWRIIEIKRGRKVRKDLAQALDCGSSLAYEPPDSLRSQLALGLRTKPPHDAALGAIEAALTDEVRYRVRWPTYSQTCSEGNLPYFPALWIL